MSSRIALACFAAAAAVAAPAVVVGASSAPLSESREQVARVNWMLKCQGCHRQDGATQLRNVPPLAGEVARVLSVPGGREYLVRVPGVATAAVPDDELADLLNWTLYRFDPANIPADFRPYSVEEVGRLRRSPYRTEATQVRTDLHALLAVRHGHGRF